MNPLPKVLVFILLSAAVSPVEGFSQTSAIPSSDLDLWFYGLYDYKLLEGMTPQLLLYKQQLEKVVNSQDFTRWSFEVTSIGYYGANLVLIGNNIYKIPFGIFYSDLHFAAATAGPRSWPGTYSPGIFGGGFPLEADISGRLAYADYGDFSFAYKYQPMSQYLGKSTGFVDLARSAYDYAVGLKLRNLVGSRLGLSQLLPDKVTVTLAQRNKMIAGFTILMESPDNPVVKFSSVGYSDALKRFHGKTSFFLPYKYGIIDLTLISDSPYLKDLAVTANFFSLFNQRYREESTGDSWVNWGLGVQVTQNTPWEQKFYNVKQIQWSFTAQAKIYISRPDINMLATAEVDPIYLGRLMVGDPRHSGNFMLFGISPGTVVPVSE